MVRATAVTILIPGQLRLYCDGAKAIESMAPDIRAMLLDLEQRYPSLYRGVCEETGVVRRHLNLFVNASHIRDLDGLATALAAGDEVMILPAVSGG